MKSFVIVASLIASPTMADHGEEHPIQALYRAAPCTETIATIDAPVPDDVAELVSVIPDQAMAWGYLLAFDAMYPSAKGERHTLLKRLRADCAASPDTPAQTILLGYTEG